MRSRFLYIRDMFVNARGNIDRFRATAVKEGHVKRGELNSYRCLLLVEGFIKVINGSPKGFCWQNMKKSVFSVLKINSRYLSTVPWSLKLIWKYLVVVGEWIS